MSFLLGNVLRSISVVMLPRGVLQLIIMVPLCCILPWCIVMTLFALNTLSALTLDNLFILILLWKWMWVTSSFLLSLCLLLTVQGVEPCIINLIKSYFSQVFSESSLVLWRLHISTLRIVFVHTSLLLLVRLGHSRLLIVNQLLELVLHFLSRNLFLIAKVCLILWSVRIVDLVRIRRRLYSLLLVLKHNVFFLYCLRWMLLWILLRLAHLIVIIILHVWVFIVRGRSVSCKLLQHIINIVNVFRIHIVYFFSALAISLIRYRLRLLLLFKAISSCQLATFSYFVRGDGVGSLSLCELFCWSMHTIIVFILNTTFIT